MISPIRQQILDALRELSELTPDVRLGQLVANLSYSAVGPTNEAIWDVEDEQLLEAIREQLAQLATSSSSAR